jgi:hypothetical protein
MPLEKIGKEPARMLLGGALFRIDRDIGSQLLNQRRDPLQPFGQAFARPALPVVLV